MVAAQLIEKIPLFAGVDRAELDGFLRIFQHVAFGAGTCLARQPVNGYFIDRDGFRMLLAQRNRAAFTIQNRITLTLCYSESARRSPSSTAESSLGVSLPTRSVRKALSTVII